MQHHWLVRSDEAFVRRTWPAVRRGLDFVVGMQLPFGGIAWSQEAGGRVNREALLAGSSSIYRTLQAGLALAELMGQLARPGAGRPASAEHALRERLDLFLDKSTFSMDWYYPVLGGAVRGAEGVALHREPVGALRAPRGSASSASTPTRG